MSDWFTVRWSEPGVVMLDQRLLPEREEYLVCASVEEVARAIESLAVRGAPAIGVRGGLRRGARRPRERGARRRGARARTSRRRSRRLGATRPTAVNLFWALERMRSCLAAEQGAPPAALRAALLREAEAHPRRGHRGVPRAGPRRRRAGAGRRAHPHPLQRRRARHRGLRHRARRRARRGRGRRARLGVRGRDAPVPPGRAPHRVGAGARRDPGDRRSTDGMAAHLMQRGEVDLVIVGADRVAANGDVANKIGTYGLALLAKRARHPVLRRGAAARPSTSRRRTAPPSPSRSAGATRWPASGAVPSCPRACPSATRPST